MDTVRAIGLLIFLACSLRAPLALSASFDDRLERDIESLGQAEKLLDYLDTIPDYPTNHAKIAGGGSHLCRIDSVYLKCWDEKGSIPRHRLPKLPQFVSKVWAGDGVHCVRSGESLYCWNWADSVVRELKDFPKSESITVSSTHVCGENSDGPRCVSLKNIDWGKRVDPPKRLSAGWGIYLKLDSAVAARDYTCATYVREEARHYRPEQKMFCTGNVLGEAPFRFPFIGTRHQPLATQEKMLCYASSISKLIECYDLASQVLEGEIYSQDVIGKVFHSQERLERVTGLVLTRDFRPCVVERVTHVDASTLERIDSTAVRCGVLSEHYSPTTAKESLQLLRRFPMEPVPYLAGATVIAPFLSGVCGLIDSQLKCWDLRKRDKAQVIDVFRDLPQLKFTLEALEQSFRSIADYTYRSKGNVLRALAEIIESLPLPGKDNEKLRLMVMNLALSVVEAIDTPLFEKDIKPIYRASLAAHNQSHSIQAIDDFRNIPRAGALGLNVLFILLSAAKNESANRLQNDQIATLCRDIIQWTTPGKGGSDGQTLKEKLKESAGLFKQVADSSKSQGIGRAIIDVVKLVDACPAL